MVCDALQHNAGNQGRVRAGKRRIDRQTRTPRLYSVVCNIILWRLISDHEHVQHIQDMRYNATQRNATQCNATQKKMHDIRAHAYMYVCMDAYIQRERETDFQQRD